MLLPMNIVAQAVLPRVLKPCRWLAIPPNRMGKAYNQDIGPPVSIQVDDLHKFLIGIDFSGAQTTLITLDGLLSSICSLAGECMSRRRIWMPLLKIRAFVPKRA